MVSDAQQELFDTGADAPETEEGAKAPKRNMMGPGASIMLSDYLRTQWTPEELADVTPEELAKEATERIGRRYTKHNVKTVADHLGLQVGEKIGESAKKTVAKLAIVAKELEAVKAELAAIRDQVKELKHRTEDRRNDD